MRATATCLSKGFWGRSLDEFKRLSNIALKLEGIKGPSGPLPLQTFHTPDSLDDCKCFYDRDIGGSSHASLDWIPPLPSERIPAHARFHGRISNALPANRPDVQRSGYAAWRTLDKPPTIFGRTLMDIDSYTYLGMRVKSDGRAYFVNVQTESIVPTDLHQHRLFAKRPGEWETVLIKWNDFVRTNGGYVVEPQTEMLRQKVRSIGVSLTDRIPGPFDLSIERIWATNDLSEVDERDREAEAETREGVREGQLKDKRGRHINWNEK